MGHGGGSGLFGIVESRSGDQSGDAGNALGNRPTGGEGLILP